MTSPLLGPKLKIDRANAHLVHLKAIENKFFQANNPEIVIDIDPQTGNKVVKAILREPPPEILHVIAGELIYQLRSSLDQIAVAMARLSVAKPNPKRVYFPTGQDLKGFKAAARSHLKSFDRDFVKAVIGLRPYDGGNDALRAVFQMGNIDKHMELIPAATMGRLAGLNHFTIRHGVGAAIKLDGRYHALTDGMVITTLLPHGEFTPRSANSQIRVAGMVTLGNVGVPHFDGRPLLPFMEEMIRATESAYRQIYALFIRSGRYSPTPQFPPDHFSRGTL
jgi:hypothetical protein